MRKSEVVIRICFYCFEGHIEDEKQTNFIAHVS